MLKVETIIRVKCTICKATFTYTTMEEVPTVCPSCNDGVYAESYDDQMAAARMKKEHGGGKTTIVSKFKV